ncbi:PREDICTED: thiosulfate sulfurtransferase/rhodanese-like domain-containing protein 1 [Cyprinodon variegatus]|uniref:Thiosulfate sulfurtransferase like domain containing 1 n=1 Tax=Cyprinodon variegatus TaxID=28743 RepID=A0A3Q2E2L6_CYPVA|nr:PREDICTED: thiosulfate sulfurtransferase/rhodanese-like domain-containing protein 1 [Cyprinodon variegatus]
MANTITYEELKALIAKSKDLVLIDVRSEDEVKRGKIAGSIHIPIQTVDAALAMTPDEFKAKYGVTKPALGDSELVFYCQIGARGARATSMARGKGYTNARNYAGAYSEWSRKQRN